METTTRTIDLINQLAQEAWDIADKAGWHDEEELFKCFLEQYEAKEKTSATYDIGRKILTRLGCNTLGVDVMSKLALITSEVAEAIECFRESSKTSLDLLYWTDTNGLKQTMTLEDAQKGRKPEGFASELVDIIIRVLHLGKSLRLDIGFAYLCKTEYNKTRGYKHGGKVA